MPIRRVWHFCACDGQCWISAFDDWQTMLTGTLALGAALLAYNAARSQAKTAQAQLDEQREQARQDREGRLRAVRASLPLVLSGICDFAERSIRALRRCLPREYIVFPQNANIDAELIFGIDVFEFSGEYVEVLGKMIELSGDNAASKIMEGLIREVQIFQARWKGYRLNSRITPSNIGRLIYQACVIRARAEILFNYARGHAADADDATLWDCVFTGMMSCEVDQIPVVSSTAREQHQHNLPPGEADRKLDF